MRNLTRKEVCHAESLFSELWVWKSARCVALAFPICLQYLSSTGNDCVVSASVGFVEKNHIIIIKEFSLFVSLSYSNGKELVITVGQVGFCSSIPHIFIFYYLSVVKKVVCCNINTVLVITSQSLLLVQK